MCGITGIVHYSHSSGFVDSEVLTRMRDSMAHRGPDGSGNYVSEDRKIGMAHRRLSIIDLSDAANQPMHDSGGRYTIVFNGEIYNHAALRVELEAIGGFKWMTDHSDTEVVINAFRHWGIDCLKRLKGMFAFALWDKTTKELWLARDRIGIKPLYYASHNGQFLFASEIKAILTVPDFPQKVNEEAMFHYLTFLVSPAPETLFQGIKKIEAGHWLKVGADGSVKVHQYWDVWDDVHPLVNNSSEEITEQVLTGLKTSVAQRKVSDRPVGVFLSGGVDSSANAILFAEGETSPVKTFTVGYDEASGYRSETGDARKIAEMIGATHEEVIVSIDDVIEFLPDMVAQQDEPLGDPVCVPLHFVSKKARDAGVIVCQVGEGADELFHGYQSWAASRKIQRINDLLPGSIARRAAATLIRRAPGVPSRRSEYFERGARGEPVFWGGATVYDDAGKFPLLTPDVRSRLNGLSSFDAIRSTRLHFEAAAWDTSVENWMTYADLKLRLPELLLMRVDKMTMGVGLEGRVPFLDHEFVSLVLSIPTDMKISGIPKSLLKNAVRGIVPEDVINRPKQGFGLTVRQWLDEILARGGASAIREFGRQAGLMDAEQLESVITSGDIDRTWIVLNLSLWWHEHFGTSAATAMRLEPSKA